MTRKESLEVRPTSYNYRYMCEYLPMRYNASYEQRENRQKVFNFKDGRASSEVLDQFISTIKSMIGYGSASDYCICFIPASEHYKNVRRYSALAARIKKEIGCSCSIDFISCPDHESGHIAGKSANPAANYSVDSYAVKGKRIILIDDVITRGRTFVQTAGLLIDNGAREVQGLFLAKTVNPDWNSNAA